jgi:diguanylate cyclase (GGDEF)-like protein
MRAGGAQMGRFGGEEFLLVFENTTTGQARALAEGLCQAMRDCEVKCGDDVVAVTLSIGLAACEAGDASFDKVARRADSALYSAKSLGRNRVEIYEAGQHAVVGLVSAGSRARHAS